MHWIDWLIMGATLVGIVVYGVWKTRQVNSMQTYLMGERDLPWWTIGLSIMATQASAITFLSLPGQAFDEGMGFAQFYIGLPIAMVILSIFVLPIYYRLKVYTAYEYLEGRFNPQTRLLTAFFFMVMRGMSAGITIFAPSIIFSSLLGWNLTVTNISMTVLVLIYTILGGTKAVSVTQKQQMIVIFIGLIIATVIMVYKMPADIGVMDSLSIAGKMGKLETVDFSFDLSNKYTIWSGILGGVFLFMSYFGTDQSQVQRYLSGKSLAQSRLGLLFNGMIKVPMQFFILFVGILVFIFFMFQGSPLHFNNLNVERVQQSAGAEAYAKLEANQIVLQEKRRVAARELLAAQDEGNTTLESASQLKLITIQNEQDRIREEAREVISTYVPDADTNDTDYVFISFVVNYLPIGLVGLLIAVIFSAAMSSIASELNALSTTSMVDLYKRFLFPNENDQHYLLASKGFVVLWGLIALGFAEAASLFENLIEAVNIIGSLFYGVILGIFLTGFFVKYVQGWSVFFAALIGEALVITIYYLSTQGVIDLAFLWLNLIGCLLVMLIAIILETGKRMLR